MGRLRCRKCELEIIFNWKMVNDKPKIHTIHGIKYLTAVCPACGFEWQVKKRTDTTRSDYHPPQTPVTP